MTQRQWLSVTEAADLIGVTRTTLHAAIRRGTLAAKRRPVPGNKPMWFIRRADLPAYQARATRYHPKRSSGAE